MSASPSESEDRRALEAGPLPRAARPLHRIADVRRQQGVSLRSLSRHGVHGARELADEENPFADIALSRLYWWQRMLEVPIADLLVESGEALSAPVLERARLIRVMKTATALGEKAATPGMQRLVETLIEQLLDIMPELKGVGPWHAVGQRRTLDEFGRIVERPVADDFSNDR